MPKLSKEEAGAVMETGVLKTLNPAKMPHAEIVDRYRAHYKQVSRYESESINPSGEISAEYQRAIADKEAEFREVTPAGMAAYELAVAQVTPYERRMFDLAESHASTDAAHALEMAEREAEIQKTKQVVTDLAPLVNTGRRVREPFTNANAARHAKAEKRDDELQELAARKWAERQHASKTATAIAQLIDPDHWTTRRKIRKPTP